MLVVVFLLVSLLVWALLLGLGLAANAIWRSVAAPPEPAALAVVRTAPDAGWGRARRADAATAPNPKREARRKAGEGW